jgi:hypothetical protein
MLSMNDTELCFCLTISTRDAPHTDLAGYYISDRISVKAGYRISVATYKLLVKTNTPAISKGQIYECFLFQT